MWHPSIVCLTLLALAGMFLLLQWRTEKRRNLPEGKGLEMIWKLMNAGMGSNEKADKYFGEIGLFASNRHRWDYLASWNAVISVREKLKLPVLPCPQFRCSSPYANELNGIVLLCLKKQAGVQFAQCVETVFVLFVDSYYENQDTYAVNKVLALRERFKKTMAVLEMAA